MLHDHLANALCFLNRLRRQNIGNVQADAQFHRSQRRREGRSIVFGHPIAEPTQKGVEFRAFCRRPLLEALRYAKRHLLSHKIFNAPVEQVQGVEEFGAELFLT